MKCQVCKKSIEEGSESDVVCDNCNLRDLKKMRDLKKKLQKQSIKKGRKKKSFFRNDIGL